MSANLQYISLFARKLFKSDKKAEELLATVAPTIFDILAMENMQSLFHASFKHFFNWLTAHFELDRFKTYGDTLYLLIHTTVEFLYLKTYDSLFSEHFYGLKRFEIKSNKQRVTTILFSIIVPYLKRRLDELYEELEKTFEPNTDLNVNNFFSLFKKIKLSIKKFLLTFYPYLHLTWSAVFLYFKFKFIIGSNDFHSPLFKLANQRLIYSNENNNESQSLLKRLLSVSRHSFSTVLFFIQFLQWNQDSNENETYLSDNQERNLFSSCLVSRDDLLSNGSSKEILDAPKLPAKLANNKTFGAIRENGLCPLCTKKRRNSSVLSVSGFVFCYACLFRFVKEHQRCPITQFPCSVKHIVRIYDSNET